MERYRSIIDDWKAFREACQIPQTSAVRKNSIKAGEDFEEQLEREFREIEQSGWNPDVFRLPGEENPGKSLLHWRGEYYVQEESAAVPVDILNPHPGDRLLDIAAAPGGKTTQIASEIENQGMVVANDKSSRRMKSLHSNIYRTGSVCVTATNYDGRHLPEDENYNRILVDAPCSGEGDRVRRKFEAADRSEIEDLSELQKQLMEKASRLLKEGGVAVYSTCTIAPEENEEVVEYVFNNTDLELEDVQIDIPHQRGLTGFRDREYSSEMRKTIRVYPHHLSSGVIYVARFRK